MSYLKNFSFGAAVAVLISPFAFGQDIQPKVEPFRKFTKIADNSTPMPEGEGNFSNVGSAVIDNGWIAFTGGGEDRRGIYLWNGSRLLRVADTTTAVPNGTGTFTRFSSPTLYKQEIVFNGKGSAGEAGLYRWKNGALSKLVDHTDALLDGTGTLSEIDDYFHDPSGSAAVLVAWQENPNGGRDRNFYRMDDTGLSRMAGLDAGYPPALGGNPSAEGLGWIKAYAFGAVTGPAIFAYRNGELMKIVEDGQSMPGGNSEDKLSGFAGDPFIDDGNLYFAAGLLPEDDRFDGEGYYGVFKASLDGDSMSRVFDTEQLSLSDPWIRGIAAENGTLVFTTESDYSGKSIWIGPDNPGPADGGGLFKYENGELETILDADDMLDGRTVMRYIVPPGGTINAWGLSDAPLDDGELVFTAYFGFEGGSAIYKTYVGDGAKNESYGLRFEKAADTGTPIPGGNGTFQSLNAASLQSGQVLFKGKDEQESWGWYLWEDGMLQTITDTGKPIPGSDGRITGSDKAVFAGDGKVVFTATIPKEDEEDGHGIYLWMDEEITPLLSHKTPLPDGKGRLILVYDMDSHGSMVYFIGVGEREPWDPRSWDLAAYYKLDLGSKTVTSLFNTTDFSVLGERLESVGHSMQATDSGVDFTFRYVSDPSAGRPDTALYSFRQGRLTRIATSEPFMPPGASRPDPLKLHLVYGPSTAEDIHFYTQPNTVWHPEHFQTFYEWDVETESVESIFDLSSMTVNWREEPGFISSLRSVQRDDQRFVMAFRSMETFPGKIVAYEQNAFRTIVDAALSLDGRTFEPVWYGGNLRLFRHSLHEDQLLFSAQFSKQEQGLYLVDLAGGEGSDPSSRSRPSLDIMRTTNGLKATGIQLLAQGISGERYRLEWRSGMNKDWALLREVSANETVSLSSEDLGLMKTRFFRLVELP